LNHPSDRTVLYVHISAAERNMFVAEQFLSSLVKEYGKHPVFQLMVVIHGIIHTSMQIFEAISLNIN
jgi:hypothetical protein